MDTTRYVPDRADRLRLAAQAFCDERTVAAAYEGKPSTRALTRARVAKAAIDLGMPPPPPIVR